MAGNGGTPNNIDFIADKNNLYREESITDLKIANIKKLIPIHLDGTPDETREMIFMGSSQLGTPHGPVPIHARLEAGTLEQALDEFPRAMEAETQKVIEQFKQMQAQQKKEQDSRIIVPGVQ
ncbi:hypothetical protein [Desulfospira joergensenii]|uniref:hypothetical protein n=1 Tax=Desulfospira joergensenii TaxID=53329 RepID=UPI0003B49DC7|nr:hypothetical protein [Desulfospira joergensenii]